MCVENIHDMSVFYRDTNVMDFIDFFQEHVDYNPCTELVSADIQSLLRLRSYESISLPVMIPGYCPCCGRAFSAVAKPVLSMSNILPKTVLTSSFSSFYVFSVYTCESCRSLFLTRCELQCNEELKSGAYGSCVGDVDDGVGLHKFVTCVDLKFYPESGILTLFSEFICDLSPRFVSLFHEAERVASCGEVEAAGCTYRKSLEVLVYDYVLQRDEHESIESLNKKSLSQIISDYVEFDDFKTVLRGAVALGNDNIHVHVKHPEYGLDDLKQLILTVVSYFDFEHMVKKAKGIIGR